MFWHLENLGPTGRGIYDSASQRLHSYAEVLDLVGTWESKLAAGKKLLVAIVGDNSLLTIVAYLAVLRAGHTAMLLGPAMEPKLRDQIFQAYQPELLVFTTALEAVPLGYTLQETLSEGITLAAADRPTLTEIHPDTAVLLSTSGTTGSPKFIRLSHKNLESNASSICSYLEIQSGESAITSLPFSYSYGLSVLNTHLRAGANIVCTNASVVSRDFWSLFTAQQCTSFSGVPLSYEMLAKLRFERMNLPSLRTLTQAGGRLGTEKVRHFQEAAQAKNLRFFVMYGQTEATARISFVPPERLDAKVGSVGIPIPDGQLTIAPREGHSASERNEGELIYSGPNVMLGYAYVRACLAKPDEMGGVLSTGDLGYADEDGFYYITGRLRRFLKIYGLRISLDEVESMLESALGVPVACAGKDELLWVLVQTTENQPVEKARERLASLYKLHHTSFQVKTIEALPTLSSGKKNYPILSTHFE